MISSDADYVMATAGLMRALADLEPHRRAQALADYAERRVKEIRAERRELRTEGET